MRSRMAASGILAAIGRHIPIDPDKVEVRVERGDTASLLEIDIEISSLAQHLLHRPPPAVEFRLTGLR